MDTSHPSGFQLKCLCPRFGDSQLGLSGGIRYTLQDFYNDAATWAPVGSYGAQSWIAGTPISCTTTDLSGRSDQFYQFDVYIGLKPSDDFLEPRPKPPERLPLKKPEPSAVPKPGEVVTMPDGSQKKVI